MELIMISNQFKKYDMKYTMSEVRWNDFIHKVNELCVKYGMPVYIGELDKMVECLNKMKLIRELFLE